MADGSPPLVVGIDGGNSKTDLVLATLDGAVRAHVRGAGTTRAASHPAETASALRRLLDQARAEAGLTSVPVVAEVDLANLDLPEEERRLHEALTGADLAQRWEVGNDTLAVLEAGAPEGHGVAVVCGTGINALAVGADGRRERFLALGAISGDWGGGSSVVRDALFHAMRDEDGRGPATSLRTALPAFFDLLRPSDLVLALHRGEISPAVLASACPAVFAEAHRGDRLSRDLLARVGREVAFMAAALLERLGGDAAETPVVLGGSLLQARDRIVEEHLTAELRARVPAARPTVLEDPPVAGALDAALRRAGATPSARARARSEIRDLRG